MVTDESALEGGWGDSLVGVVLHKQEELSLDPQYSHKAQAW